MSNINIESKLSFQLRKCTSCYFTRGRTDMRMMVRELRNVREPKLNSVSAAALDALEECALAPKVRPPCCKLLSQPPAPEILHLSGPLQREQPWRTIFTLPTTSMCLFHLGPNRPRPQ